MNSLVELPTSIAANAEAENASNFVKLKEDSMTEIRSERLKY